MVYARKISEDSWFGSQALDADAISELSTCNHDLSVWKIDNPSDERQMDDVALALALSRNAVDELYVVLIDLDKIKDGYRWNVELREEDGVTGFEMMKGRHINLELFSFWHQGFLAEYIHSSIQDEANYRYYDVTRLVDLLDDATRNNRIDRNFIKKNYGKWNKMLLEKENFKVAS